MRGIAEATKVRPRQAFARSKTNPEAEGFF
jgi:hypothetical protein